MIPTDKVNILTGKTKTAGRKGDSGKDVTYYQCEKVCIANFIAWLC